MAERTDQWWNLLGLVERVINGNYYMALGRTPFEAFYRTSRVHQLLLKKREEEVKRRNEGKKAVAGHDLT